MSGGEPPPRVVIRYASFPRDGAYHWLRWVDGVDVRGRGSGHPAIHAHLSPLSGIGDGGRFPSLADVAGSGAGHVPYPVETASLPDLRLGTVFKDGVDVGSLAMVPRTFAFDRPPCGDALVRCNDVNPMPRPHWWKYAWQVLPAAAYALGERRAAFCLVLREGTRQLVIPASEVFRTFCAPERRLAEALLSGPWDLVRDRIVNPSWTEDLGDRWEIGLRTGLTARSALPAAAFELSNYGKAVAAMMHAPSVGPSARITDLRAGIPYEWDSIALDVEGVAFPEAHGGRLGLDRFLCLRIEGVEWRKPLPGLPRVIAYRLDNNNVTRNPDPPPVEGDRPIPKASPPPGDDPTGSVPADVANPASKGVEPLATIAPVVATIDGGPMVERLALVEPEGPSRPPRKSYTTGSVDHASPTGTDPGGGNAAPLRNEPGPEPSISAFAELADALDALVDDKSIQDWSPTGPVDAKWDARDGFHAWCFPGHAVLRRIGWSYVVGTRRRTALVCRIRVGGSMLHLIETERRPGKEGASTEGFSMLLLEAAGADLEPAVGRLLDIAALGRGVWPDPAAWTAGWTGSGGGVVRIAKRRHEYAACSVDQEGARLPRRLDQRSLHRWMTSFLATDAPSAEGRHVG